MIQRIGEEFAGQVHDQAAYVLGCDLQCVDDFTADWQRVDPMFILTACDCDSPVKIEGQNPWDLIPM